MTLSRFSAVALTGLAAVTLAACHPPSEQDSDMKTDNASTYTGSYATLSSAATASSTAASASSAAGEPTAVVAENTQFIDCVAAPVTEPEVITLNCVTGDVLLTDITWTSWEQDQAEGTGTRVEGRDRTEDVAVVLSNPVESSQGVVFGQIEVDGEVVTP